MTPCTIAIIILVVVLVIWIVLRNRTPAIGMQPINGVANIQPIGMQPINGVANIQPIDMQPINGVANRISTDMKPINGVANRTSTGMQSINRISNVQPINGVATGMKPINGVANVQPTGMKPISGVANVQPINEVGTRVSNRVQPTNRISNRMQATGTNMNIQPINGATTNIQPIGNITGVAMGTIHGEASTIGAINAIPTNLQYTPTSQYPNANMKPANKVALLIESVGGIESEVSSVSSARLAASISNIPLEVYDTKGSVQTTLSLLNQLYSQGYRDFVGFNRSSLLEQVIPWFKQHPDTRAISPVSSASSLISDDNVIRIVPSNKTVFEGILSAFSDDYNRAIAVVQKNDLYATDALNIITNASTNTVLDPITIDSITVDLTNLADRRKLKAMLDTLDSTTVVIPLFSNRMPEFRTLAGSSTGKFDVMEGASIGIAPVLPNGYMPGRYNTFLPVIETTSEGNEIASTVSNFSLPTYEAVVMAGSSREAKISFCGPNNIIPLNSNQDRAVSRFIVNVWDGSAWKRVGNVGAKIVGGGYYQSPT